GTPNFTSNSSLCFAARGIGHGLSNIHPKVLSLQHGWDEANANILIDEDNDPISGYPGFKTLLRRLTKAGAELRSNDPLS
ncbi:MAG: hypothetical protein QMC90_00595, partial [Dehalococcoidales bacterium]|nr:hypothetical protein [Dehalococcoidales bacterium]